MRTKANHTYPLAYMHSGNQQYLPLGDAQIIQSLIQSIIPADFNGDGMLDVLVQSGIGGSLSSSTTIHFGDRTEFTSSGAFAEPADSSVHLLLMDYNLDMKPDLFGQAPNGTRVFWVNNGDGTFNAVPFPSQTELNPLAKPHSNAFVDINGDCLADLVIFSLNSTTGTKVMEIWTFNENQWNLDRLIPLPEGAGQVSFADFGASTSFCWIAS